MSVEWAEDTLDRLADTYVEATPEEREAIARCVERINAQLAVDPWTPGVDRGPAGVVLVPVGGRVRLAVRRRCGR